MDTFVYGHISLLTRSIAAPSTVDPQGIYINPILQGHTNLYNYPSVVTASTQSAGSCLDPHDVLFPLTFNITAVLPYVPNITMASLHSSSTPSNMHPGSKHLRSLRYLICSDMILQDFRMIMGFMLNLPVLRETL